MANSVEAKILRCRASDPRILGGIAGGVMSRVGKINKVGGSERY